MESAGDALRSVSDSLLSDLEALVAAEHEKRKVSPNDPRLVTLAAEVDMIARRVLGLSERQQDIAGDIHERAIDGDPGAPTESIEEIIRPLGVILADWRAAERDATAAKPDSADAKAARSLADKLRDEYRRAYEAHLT
jgi:hypothetical protein